jgi:L-threonylcarbamoyladenylate synthase
MLARHYAPRTPLELVARGDQERLDALLAAGRRVGWLSLGPSARSGSDASEADKITVVAMPTGAPDYAARLYAALHVLDAAGLDVILAEMPPDEEEWLAVRDRLRRASSA